MGKRIKLEELKTISGIPFRDAELDGEGNTILDLRKDAEGNTVMQVPRDNKGEPFPNVMPEPVYTLRTKEMKKGALLELLKTLYLRIPNDKLVRQDTIYGTRMFENINQAKNGYLEMDEDVHDWVKKKLQDENIGIKIFDKNLWIIEQAVDNFDRLHEKGEPKK